MLGQSWLSLDVFYHPPGSGSATAVQRKQLAQGLRNTGASAQKVQLVERLRSSLAGNSERLKALSGSNQPYGECGWRWRFWVPLEAREVLLQQCAPAATYNGREPNHPSQLTISTITTRDYAFQLCWADGLQRQAYLVTGFDPVWTAWDVANKLLAAFPGYIVKACPSLAGDVLEAPTPGLARPLAIADAAHILIDTHGARPAGISTSPATLPREIQLGTRKVALRALPGKELAVLGPQSRCPQLPPPPFVPPPPQPAVPAPGLGHQCPFFFFGRESLQSNGSAAVADRAGQASLTPRKPKTRPGLGQGQGRRGLHKAAMKKKPASQAGRAG